MAARQKSDKKKKPNWKRISTEYITGALNFDHPNAIDWDLLVKNLRALKEGREVEQPVLLKCIGIMEELVDQEGLSNPSAAVDRNQLRPVFVHSFLKKLEFSLPSNHSHLYLAIKVLKRYGLAKYNVTIWPQRVGK